MEPGDLLADLSNRKFLNTIIARVDTNDEIFKKILDDEEFKNAVEGFYLRKVYDRLRDPSATE